MLPYRTRSIFQQNTAHRAAKTGMNVRSVVYAASMRFLSHRRAGIYMVGLSQGARVAVAEDCAGNMSIVPAVIRELAARFFLV